MAHRSSSFTQALQRGLESPRVIGLAALVAIALTAPSLTAGLATDDHIHRVAALGHPSVGGTPRAPWDLFSFMRGDVSEKLDVIDRIAGAWMLPDDFQIAFLRPLSSLTHALDYRLRRDDAWLMHLQNLLWYGGLVYLVGLLYRGVLGPGRIAGLAVLLYAVDDAHGVTVGWIANRNALVAGVFGVLTLLAYDSWRRRQWQSGAWLGPLCFAVALAGGESAIAVGAYLLAHALCLARDDWRTRLASLMPYGVLAVTWQALYSTLGYGALGTDLYIDPGRESTVFLFAIVERLPVLMLGQLGLPPSELWMFLSDQGRIWLAASGALFLAMVTVIALPLLRRSPEARFFGLGALLAAIPISATYPFDRLLTYVGIGAFGLVAQFLFSAFEARRLPALLLGGVWILLHVVIAPVALPLRALEPSRWDALTQSVNDTLPAGEVLDDEHWIFVNAPDVIVSFYVMLRRASLEEPLPGFVRYLSISVSPIEMRRDSIDSVTLRWADGLLTRPFDRMLRGRRHTFRVGDAIELTDLRAEVTSVTPDGRAAEVRYRFSVPLEDASLKWMTWVGRGYEPFAPPAVGETRTLPAIDFFEALR